jgi:predicted RNA binding protein YcfA (HicA-like mRNA interferase family)
VPRLPGFNHLDAIRALERVGFEIRRQCGHVVMEPDGNVVVVPRNNPINAFTMGAIARQAGLTPDQFRALL